jgi:hypothetical protein
MKFAIDNIPSLADRMPYASYVVLHGDESDGVPEYIGDNDTDAMPPPPKTRVPFADTVAWRKL